MKVCFETFGCRLNRAEALQQEAEYLAKGWQLTEKHSDANLIIVRGCSVTAKAQKNCELTIAHLKRKYPNTRVLVTGCLPSAQKPAQQQAHDNKFPVSPDTISQFPNQSIQSVNRSIGQSVNSQSVNSPLPTRTARAYLKVQDGCSGACTFCIVPKFRGKSVSKPFEELIDQAKRFVDSGYHEIVVTGCNLSMYCDGMRHLPELLDALSAVDPGCRIRLGSLEPIGSSAAVVELMAERKNLCRFLHLPIQSGSQKILTAMKRPYSVKDVDSLVGKAAELMPGLGLGCDLMTGFPGETEIDFTATVGLLKRLPFTKAHVFPYSERPGTVAVAMPDAVPVDVRRHRAHVLADIADEKRRLYTHRLVGKEVEVILEDAKHFAGWTSEYVWCQPGDDQLVALTHRSKELPGRKEKMRFLVRSAHAHVLTGDVLN